MKNQDIWLLKLPEDFDVTVTPFVCEWDAPIWDYNADVLPTEGLLLSATYVDDAMVDSVGESTRPNQLRQSGYFNGTGDTTAIPLTGADIDEFRGVLRVSDYPGANAYLFGSKASDARFYLMITSTGNISGFLGGPGAIASSAPAAADMDITVSLKNNGDGTGTLTVGEVSETGNVLSTSDNDVNLLLGGLSNKGSYLGGLSHIWQSVELLKNGVVVASYSHPTKTGSSEAVWFDRSGNGKHATATVTDVDAHCNKTLAYGSNTLELEGYSEGGGSYDSSVLIPLLSDLSTDCLGNTPTHIGRAKYNKELTEGSVDDITNASWEYPQTGEIYDADQALGGDIFYDSTDGLSSFDRSYGEWVALPECNDILDGRFGEGPRGGYLYNTSQEFSFFDKGQRYIGNTLPSYIRDLTESNAAVRIFNGRIAHPHTIVHADGPGATFLAVFELAAVPDTVRVIYANGGTSIYSYSGTRVAAISPEDLNGDLSSWVTAPHGGTPVPERPSGSVPGLTMTGSVAISNPNQSKLVAVKSFVNTVTDRDMTVLGSGADDFTNWATRDGHRVLFRNQDGESLFTGFTSTTNVSFSPIIGVAYTSGEEVFTCLTVGDSTEAGRGTYLGSGPMYEALRAAGNRQTWEIANLAWSGSRPEYFNQVLSSAIAVGIVPDMCVCAVGSPNDTAEAITEANVTDWKNYLAQTEAICVDNGINFIPRTMTPANSSIDTPSGVRDWGTDDERRVAINAEFMDTYSICFDYSEPVSALSVNTNGQIPYLAGMTTDSIHQNDAGLAAEATQILVDFPYIV